MVSAALKIAFTGNLLRIQRASEEAEPGFVAKARALGFQANPLVLGKPARVFPWIRPNKEFLRVSWLTRKSFSFLGLLEITSTKRDSGIFRKHPAIRVLMPLEAERAAQALRTLPEIQEMAVLEERRIDPILAVRVDGQWYEIYRWWQSPVVLPDDCPLISQELAAATSLNAPVY